MSNYFASKKISFHPFGEQALLVNFKQEIEETINQQVIQLDNALQTAKLPAITFTIPAYCSLTIGYDSNQLDYETLRIVISKIIDTSLENTNQMETRQLTIPVCYDLEYGLDLEEIASEKSITTKEVIQYHSAPNYKVYLLGFLPGFTFMGKISKQLSCSRKKEPRLRVPALSVGIAGDQTGIYPSEVPGGWQILGRTPLPIFDASKKHPFLFQAGDRVQFYPIFKKEFLAIKKDVQNASFNWQSIYG